MFMFDPKSCLKEEDMTKLSTYKANGNQFKFIQTIFDAGCKSVDVTPDVRKEISNLIHKHLSGADLEPSYAQITELTGRVEQSIKSVYGDILRQADNAWNSPDREISYSSFEGATETFQIKKI